MRAGLLLLAGALASAACADTNKDASSRKTLAQADSATGRSEAASATSRSTGEPPRVLFVGTSLTAGFGLDSSDAFPALLARRAASEGLRYEFVNAGLSGETSAGALRRMDWLLRAPAEVFVIETGANDGLRGLDVEATRENIRAIIGKVKAARPGARILLAQMEAPPNLGVKYTTGFRTMFQDVARDEGVVLIPFLLEGVAGVGRMNQSDGMHPNEAGERIVADNVWRTLHPVLVELDQTKGKG